MSRSNRFTAAGRRRCGVQPEEAGSTFACASHLPSIGLAIDVGCGYVGGQRDAGESYIARDGLPPGQRPYLVGGDADMSGDMFVRPKILTKPPLHPNRLGRKRSINNER